jgi:hypothetical protein
MERNQTKMRRGGSPEQVSKPRPPKYESQDVYAVFNNIF